MKKRKSSASKRPSTSKRSKPTSEEALQGPPARETVWERSDAERAVEAELRAYTSTSPSLAGGDVDADWQRADSVGEEAPGGTVATPGQDVVDDIGRALGVSRAPDEAFRPSSEILEGRDRKRHEQEE
ncbi:MAG TPA: DUF6335 family protein [Methylomirabilota bacterium]|jgi:Family of unknown function (DUF6335)|nr:DUF6335 family protein [Methylomirabilota bacterium]